MKSPNPNSKRLNLTIPVKTYNEIIFVSRRMGVSSSGLIYQMISEAVHHMATVLKQAVPNEDVETTVKRLRGASTAYIEAQYDDLKKELAKDDNHVH